MTNTCNNIILNDNIDHDNFNSIFEQLINILKDNDILEIDFSRLTSYNSCVLLLIINITRQGKLMGKKVNLINLPDQIIQLSKVYNLKLFDY